ncbi:hypothetical protein [Photobacterium damselae]|uniref:hypothetical protein n=1 Tax=Photobacterium damselae TaxID=38293 RepID=UPI001302D9BE|nr:hypothetical protein [Photobacterium damselae]
MVKYISRVIFTILILSSTYSIQAKTGQEILDNIVFRYSDTILACQSNESPAYACSGAVVHGVGSGMPWAPPSDNSMSFSYLRKDVLNPLYGNYGYGIILIPQNDIVGNLYKPDYRCTFPINGGSNDRLDNGCGAFGDTIELEPTAPCQKNGIFDGISWADQFNSLFRFCGFDLKGKWGDKPEHAFNAMLEASTINIETNNRLENNEIVINSWGNTPLDMLPIEAIYYLNNQGATIHLNNAREAQIEYTLQTGKWIPIIQLEKINSETGYGYNYKFAFYDNDQAIE